MKITMTNDRTGKIVTMERDGDSAWLIVTRVSDNEPAERRHDPDGVYQRMLSQSYSHHGWRVHFDDDDDVSSDLPMWEVERVEGMEAHPEEKVTHEMSDDQLKQMTKAHREEETECRWCFAIDLQRVKANMIDRRNFPDATVLHLKCPRCGGEFSYYIQAWGEDYLKERISAIHPEFGEISEEFIREVNDRMWPEVERL